MNIYAIKGDEQSENSIQSTIIAMVFSMATEIERDVISKKTKKALIARKMSDMRLGKPKIVGKRLNGKLSLWRA
jgi:DNA invertase Pin-like site-specific DNA recombinase